MYCCRGCFKVRAATQTVLREFGLVPLPQREDPYGDDPVSEGEEREAARQMQAALRQRKRAQEAGESIEVENPWVERVSGACQRIVCTAERLIRKPRNAIRLC